MIGGGTVRLVACNVGVLVVGLVIIEAVFGNWFSPSNLGFLNVPRNVLIKHKVHGNDPETGISIYRKDQHGFRGRYGAPSDIDILAIGGSTTNELYTGEGDTWVDVLQKELKRYGHDVRIANAGVDGHSTNAHLRSFDLWYGKVPGLKPRYTLFYVGLNDVHVHHHVKIDLIEPTSPGDQFLRYAKNNSALYYLYQTIRGLVRAHRVRLVYRDEPPTVRFMGPLPTPPPVPPGRLAQYRERLLGLAEASRQIGATPIFVTQRRGNAYRIDGVWHATGRAAVFLQSALEEFNRVTMSVCRDVQGICIDLAKNIRFEPRDFADSMHTTASGSRKIGLFFAARLKDHL